MSATPDHDQALLREIDFAKSRGLVPVVTCDADTNEVLMVAYMNEQAFRHTLETGLATYWSRSRNELWTKGLTSGHVQKVRWIRLDCDGDCILLGVEQVGPACHTNRRTCFYRELRDGQWVTFLEPVEDE
ncbi:MAG: phosphoribosyl-AMP cyclohydrolase [Armatimonadetes bacterium]|nr:phosphoribosyl-AMP cyclohydrolase [Armatimonadota bacterium]